MVRTCVDSALEDLQWLESDPRLTITMKDQIKTLKTELRFLRVLLLYVANWANARFRSLPRIIEAALSNAAQGLYAAGLLSMHKRKVKDWELSVSNLLEKIDDLKPEIREACDVLSKCTLEIESPVGAELLLEFLDPLLENLNSVVALRADMILSLKKQIEALESKLKFLRSFVRFTSKHCHENEKFDNLLTHVGAVSSNSACLSYLCWIDQMDEDIVSGINVLLSDLLENLKPSTSEVIEMYLGLLRASKPSVSRLKHEVVVSFVDFLLENMMVHMKDQIEILHEGLVLLIVYLMDPLGDDSLYRKKMLKLIEAVVIEAQSLITYSYKIDITTEETQIEVSLLLSKLQEKVKFVEVELFLMELLRHNSTWMASVKDHIAALHEGLRFLIFFLMDPPKKSREDGELMFAHMEEVAKEAGSLIDSIDGDLMTESFVMEMNLVLVKFFEHVELIKRVEFLIELLNGKASRLVPEKHIIGSLVVELSFLKAFLMDLPEEYKSQEKLIFIQIEAVVSDTVSFLCFKDNKVMEESTLTKMNLLLSALLEKIMILKAEVHEIYLQVPRSSMSNFPRTDGVGFVEFFIGNLRELLNDKVDLISLIKNQVETILRELDSLKPFLGQNEQEEQRDLGRCVRDVAYQAEYVIDLYLVKGGAAWYCILWLSDLIEEIMIIKKDATKFSENTNHTRVLNFQNTSSQESFVGYGIPASGLLVGLNNKAKDIKNRLLGGCEKLEIIPIIGMAGLGKTTLAKNVYEDPSVSSQFHIRAWCYVSQVYEKRDLILDILAQVIKSTDGINDKATEEDLAQQLYQSLKGQKYLIVMDDFWDVDAWNGLRFSFPDDHKASRIIFTSRLLNIASQAGLETDPYSLCLLTLEECSELLQKILFQKEGWPIELSVVGRKIAEKCEGLPLVVVVIAGVLSRMKREEAQWKAIEENLESTVFGDPKHFMGNLDMSYKHLPDHLKACFLYLGAFAYEKEIPVWKLTWLWIAEGFVRKPKEGSLEDAAESYLMDLIDRSLVMIAKRRSDGRVKACHIHNLLRDLCLKKAKEENFLQLIKVTDEFSSSEVDFCVHRNSSSTVTTHEQHRLCIYSERKDFVLSRPSGPCARSLLFFAFNDVFRFSQHYDISFISRNFKILRVLDLGSINMGDSFPLGLELLIHLRYLAIRGNVNALPSSIVSLWNLETLLVRGLRGEIVMPDTFWNMVRLRHVQIIYRAYISLDDYRFWGSSCLDNLEILTTLCFYYSRGMVEEILRRLPNLRKLRCILLESWNNRFPELSLLSKLETLQVVNHGHLLYPCHFSLPKSLKKLTLSKLQLPWDNISTIGSLPNLEVLKLLYKAFHGRHWDMKDGEFPKLKYLKLDSLYIAEWNASSEHFACLQQLVLKRCEDLQEIPSCLREIPTLQLLEVRWCSSSTANSAREIQKEQLETGNEGLRVFIDPQDLDVNSSSQ